MGEQRLRGELGGMAAVEDCPGDVGGEVGEPKHLLRIPAASRSSLRSRTGERIRDTIASKQKGMWMGGVPPLGYACRDHKLILIDSEAGTVRHIFRRYAALGSVTSRSN